MLLRLSPCKHAKNKSCHWSRGPFGNLKKDNMFTFPISFSCPAAACTNVDFRDKVLERREDKGQSFTMQLRHCQFLLLILLTPRIPAWMRFISYMILGRLLILSDFTYPFIVGMFCECQYDNLLNIIFMLFCLLLECVCLLTPLDTLLCDAF